VTIWTVTLKTWKGQRKKHVTKAEHKKAYIAARRETARQVIAGKRKIRQEYVHIIAKIAAVVRANRFKPFLEEQIRAAFPRKELYNWLMTLILNGRANTARLVADIEKRYIFETLDKVPGHGMSKDKIAAMFEAKIARTKIANSKPFLDVVKNVKEKKYVGTGFTYRPEGKWKDTRIDYTFRQSFSLSKSVWDTVNYTEDKILDVVWGGVSQGRDVRTVAADLMAYIHEGPQVLPGRWGKLEPGTREYARRLGKMGVDYRAMRLFRSEKYRHLQEAAVEDGESNPGCTGEYDWILMPGRGTWNCDCPDIAAAGPYKADTIPPYRHSNCDCMIEPRMKDHDEFVRQLRDYVQGEDTPGAREIDEWALGNGLGEESQFAKPPSGEYQDFEQRFGKEFTQFYEKSMNYIDSNSPIPDNVKKELDDYLRKYDKTADSFIKEVNDFIKTGEVVRHDPLDRFLENIDDFEKDPRIKTQFETETSEGYLGENLRNFWERRLIGEASTYGEKPGISDMTNYGIENVYRPVYTEVTQHHPLEGNANSYGQGKGEDGFAWVFTDQARKRASYTLGNSSILGMGSFKNDAASIFSKPGFDIGNNLYNFLMAQENTNSYVEAQVWGGIDLRKGDVKAVVIKDSVFAEKENDTAFQRFIQVIKNNNIPVIKGSEWGKKANAKAIDIASMVVYNDKQKVGKMRLLAKCGENNLIYDAGDSWYHFCDREHYILKTEQPQYPNAACIKWGFEPVDVDYLNALIKGGLEGVEEYLKTHP
jgi:hypothetical protein